MILTKRNPTCVLSCVLVALLALCLWGCGLPPESRTPGANSATTAAHNELANVTSSAVTPKFTISVSPSSGTVLVGKSASAKVTTTIVAGYNHALNLSASNVPAGVTVKFTPTQVPAPGAGASIMAISVASTAAPGTYSIHITATDGSNSATVTLSLKVAPNPEASFQGCWYKSGGHSYQGVEVSAKNPGSYTFYGDLYYGSTCSQWADYMGTGQPVNFGLYGYTFWFTGFPDQKNMSAIYKVGAQKSQCISYASAPNCP